MVIPLYLLARASFTQTTAGPYSMLHMSTACSWLAKVTGVSHKLDFHAKQQSVITASPIPPQSQAIETAGYF